MTQMRAVCTICADTLKDDFSAAPCGHTFHFTCLDQWLAYQKNCPQCRVPCLKRQVLKLFLDSGASADTTIVISDDDVSKDELKEHLKTQRDLAKEKDKALKETLEELRQVKDELVAWKSQHDSVKCQLKQERSQVETLKDHMRFLQNENEQLVKRADEAMELRRKLTRLEKIEHLLNSSRANSTTQELVDKASHSALKDYYKVVANEYESLKRKWSKLQEDKKSHLQDLSLYKMKLSNCEDELCKAREKLSFTESDLQAVESERDSLTKKIHLLEKAIESPNSRVALRRLLESPLPDKLDFKRPKLDLSSTLNGSFLSSADNKENKPPTVPTKSVKEEISAPVLISNSTAASTSSEFLRVGFNGLGGHTNYIKPKIRPVTASGKSGVNEKQLKFAPRLKPSSSSSKPIRSTGATSNLKQLKMKFRT